MTLTASPVGTRTARISAALASGSLLVLGSFAAASIATSHASIVGAVHVLLTLR